MPAQTVIDCISSSADEAEEPIWNHKALPEEVEEAATTRPRYETRGRDGTELVYGTTATGRYLFIVFGEALNGLSYVVTARNMEENERGTYKRKAR